MFRQISTSAPKTVWNFCITTTLFTKKSCLFSVFTCPQTVLFPSFGSGLCLFSCPGAHVSHRSRNAFKITRWLYPAASVLLNVCSCLSLYVIDSGPRSRLCTLRFPSVGCDRLRPGLPWRGCRGIIATLQPKTQPVLASKYILGACSFTSVQYPCTQQSSVYWLVVFPTCSETLVRACVWSRYHSNSGLPCD